MSFPEGTSAATKKLSQSVQADDCNKKRGGETTHRGLCPFKQQLLAIKNHQSKTEIGKLFQMVLPRSDFYDLWRAARDGQTQTKGGFSTAWRE